MQVSTIPSTRRSELSIGLIITNSNNTPQEQESVNGAANEHRTTDECGSHVQKAGALDLFLQADVPTGFGAPRISLLLALNTLSSEALGCRCDEGHATHSPERSRALELRVGSPSGPTRQIPTRQWAMSCLLLRNFAHSLGVSSKQLQHFLQ